MKLSKFLKPDLKKILLFLVLVSPVLSMLIASVFEISFKSWLLPEHYDFLYGLMAIYFTLLIIISVLFFGVGPDMGMEYPEWYRITVIAISFLLIIYILSCAIIISWNKLSEKARLYGKIIIIVFLFLFSFSTIILPIIKNRYVVVNKNTLKNISANEVYYSRHSKLQELIIQNNSIISVKYELPNTAVCLYDIENNSALNYSVEYKTNDNKFIRSTDKFHRAVITIQPNSKVKVYLQKFFFKKLDDKEKEKYDELLLISNGNCKNIKREDIINAERIKINY